MEGKNLNPSQMNVPFGGMQDVYLSDKQMDGRDEDKSAEMSGLRW